MELKEYGNALRRWWWLLLIAFLLGGAAAYRSVRHNAPAYQASTRLLVNQVQAPGGPSNDSLQASERLAKTYSEMIHSPQVLNDAVAQLNAHLSAGALNAKIAADPVRDTRFIQISAEDTDPKFAAAIANTLARVLVKHVQDLQTSNTQAALQQVDGDIAVVQGQINDTSTKLNTLRSTLDANSVTMHDIERLQQQLTQYDQDLRDTRFRISDVSGRLNQLKTSPDPNNTAPAEIQRLQDQLNQLNQDLSDSRQRYNDTSAQLDRLRAIPAPGGLASSDAQALQDLLSQYQQRYGRLLDTRQTITLAQAQGFAAVTITDTAAVPTVPEPSKLVQNVGLGALLGLLLAAGLAVLLSRFDDRIRSPRDIGERLDVTTLATVPSVQRNTPRVVKDANAPTSELTEALRLLRTSLPALPRIGAQVICVTSARRREGKSIVAANLAIIEAQANLRVILIDANLRHPSLHTLFDLPNERGLSTLLTQQESDLDALLQKGPSGIEILTSGPVPANPGALLDSPFMAALIYDLRNRADMIILDAAPVLPVIDALMLQQHVDGNIVVADVRRVGTRKLGHALAAIEHVAGVAWGVVLNRAKRGQQPYIGAAEPTGHDDAMGGVAPRKAAAPIYVVTDADSAEAAPQPVALSARRRGDTPAVPRIAGRR